LIKYRRIKSARLPVPEHSRKYLQKPEVKKRRAKLERERRKRPEVKKDQQEYNKRPEDIEYHKEYNKTHREEINKRRRENRKNENKKKTKKEF